VIATVANVSSEFHREIVEPGRLAAFLFFVALLGTFGFIRTSTHMIKAQVSWWPGNVNVGGTHVHHLVWGIFAMMIFGYIGVVHQPDSPWHEVVAVFFGIGMGLTLDEFALWLELKDVYWAKDGRKSVDAMVIAASLAALGLIGLSAWVKLADGVETELFAAVGIFNVIGILVALVNAAKQKLWMIPVGLVFWPAAVVTAARLAKPRSLWAHVFYRRRRLTPHGERKLERSRRRYETGAGDGSGPGPAEPSPAAPSSSASSDS
jgi:hypothetical protein